jgi:hydrogenase expression/formation protein HypC
MMCLSLPGKVLTISHDGALPMAEVDFGGVSKSVCLAYTPEVKIGEYVVVHVGFAITILSVDEALKTLKIAEEEIV